MMQTSHGGVKLQNPESDHGALTDFGFQSISMGEKRRRVRDLFQDVTPHYDLMNTLMSAGLHRFWKRKFVAQLPLGREPMHILDVASGTADIGQLLIERFQALGGAHRMTFCDLTEGMLAVGKKKIERVARETFSLPLMNWVCGMAENLPLPNESVDIYTIVFGLRNVANKPQALHEAYRVLKPGGVFCCLEFSQPTNPFLLPIYRFYRLYCIPLLGAFIARNKRAYQYLAESIQTFPSQKIISYMLEETSFHSVSVQSMSEGIVTIHRAQK